MTELKEVLIFCAMYSGVVLFALWQTVAQETSVRKLKKQSFPPK